MAIADDFSVAVNGDIRYTGTTANYTVLELHRFLQDLADDAVASGDDLLAISDETPSDRSTDNIVTLINGYNIDATAAIHLYDGSVSQGSGGTAAIYAGLVVVGAVETGTEVIIIQNNGLLTDTWTAVPNADAAANIILRCLVLTHTSGADIDGQRLIVQAREYGDTYAEFSVTMGLGNNTAALFTSNDLNNSTAQATVNAWTITNTEGYQGLDVSGDAVDEFYYSQWNLGIQSINDLYEFGKDIQRRGTAETLYGLSGSLFRGITHEIVVDTPTGTFSAFEPISWSGGTGQMLAIDSTAAATKMWMQLLTGTAPINNDVITGGTSAATATMNVTITARTVPGSIMGVSTGSAIIGAYGLGIDPTDLSASDQLFDLDNALVVPPNNVTFTVSGLVSGEDRVLVGPESGGVIDVAQLALNTTLAGAAETAVVLTGSIPTDTPTTGTIRIQLDSGIYRRVAYTSYTGSTFTIGATNFTSDNATSANNVWISYIDVLAGSTSESFTGVYLADRALFVRVRDGGGTPIKTFETTGTLGAAGGAATAIRASDA